MTKRIAIIPARGGSKRIPGKNIKNFCGKPIISYSLDVAKASNLFDVIHVSTDSIEIANLVKDLGYSVDFMRPKSLSDDHTPIMPVLRWVMDQYSSRGVRFDEVVAVMPCAPFIESSDLEEALQLLKNNNYKNPVLAVSTYSTPIEWAFNKEESGLLDPVQQGMFEKRSQDLPKYYFDTGSFACFSNEYINNSSGAGNDTSYLGHVIDKYKSIDIDTIDDWKFAEIVFYGLNKVLSYDNSQEGLRLD